MMVGRLHLPWFVLLVTLACFGATCGHASDAVTTEVVATGEGVDSEKAKQDAFSNAIQEVVGVYVDAESVVKNERLIRDEILTVSKGYIEKYDTLRQWTDNGLSHVEIRAVVRRGKVYERLKEIKVPVAKINGDLLGRQLMYEIKNEEQAAKILAKELADFDLVKLVKVEKKKQGIRRSGTDALESVKVRLSPDAGQWTIFFQNLRPVLALTSTRRATVHLKGTKAGDVRLTSPAAPEKLQRQLEGDGILVGVFVSNSGESSVWEVFRVPQLLEVPLKEAATVHRAYQVTCTLRDKEGNAIETGNQPIELKDSGLARPLTPIFKSSASHYGVRPAKAVSHTRPSTRSTARRGKTSSKDPEPAADDHALKFAPGVESWWIGPVWFGRNSMSIVYESEVTVTLSPEELTRVADASPTLRHFTHNDPKKRTAGSSKRRRGL